MTIKEAIHRTAGRLEAAGVPDPQIDAELLVMHVTGFDRMSMRLGSTTQLTMEQEQRLSSLLLSRAQRKPLQYLLGTQYFYGLPFSVDERVLIPRQETESLCELGIAHLRTLKGECRALDLCTGSGAIAVTLKHEHPAANVTACDLSADALAVAQQNAKANGAEITFLQGDLWEPVCGMRFDLILSNPPYQTDFSVAKGFIEKGFNRLKIGGRLCMVTKRREWYKNKLISVFGGVEIRETDGYYVFIAQRRSMSYAEKAKKRK